MAEAGRKTILDKELLAKIKESIINGNSLIETAKLCGISESTLYMWHSDNYLSLADKVENWKRDRKLMLAENNIEEFLKMDCNNTKAIDGDYIKFVDPQLVESNRTPQSLWLKHSESLIILKEQRQMLPQVENLYNKF